MRKATPAWQLYVLEWSNGLVSMHILVVLARYVLPFLFSNYANNVSVISSEFQ